MLGDVVLIIPVLAAAILVGSCTAVDAVDRIRDHDPAAVISAALTVHLYGGAIALLIILLEIL